MDLYLKRNQQELRNPSFSATLLDSIYRSIDKGDLEEYQAGPELITSATLSKDSMKKKQCIAGERSLRRKSMPEARCDWQRAQRSYLFHYSSSNSSDASESESRFTNPKQVRTGVSTLHKKNSVSAAAAAAASWLPEIEIPRDRYANVRVNSLANGLPEKNAKSDSYKKSKLTAAPALPAKGFSGDEPKKPKQPSSPGRRLASFLNSLFAAAAANAKKTKLSSSDRKASSDRSLSPASSLESSWSRSCLSKTPSSRGNSVKSVRFCPVNFVVGEELSHQKHGRRTEESPRSVFGEELKVRIMEKNRRVEEAAKELLHGYRRKSELLREVMRDVQKHSGAGEDDGEEEGDTVSCASSDLFELENWSEIGVNRYGEELPVYETTSLDKNMAIANGRIR